MGKYLKEKCKSELYIEFFLFILYLNRVHSYVTFPMNIIDLDDFFKEGTPDIDEL